MIDNSQLIQKWFALYRGLRIYFEMFSWLVLNIVFDCCIIDNLSGAILANGRGGRENTLKQN